MKVNILRTYRSVRNRFLFPEYNHNVFNEVAAVFPDIRVVYNRIKKSGNTSICAFFSDFGGSRYTSSPSLKRQLRTPLSLRGAGLRQIDKYYSVVFVRNPYSRVLSAFLQKLSDGSNYRYRKYPGYGQNHSDGFEVFLRYLDSGGLYDNKHWWPQVDLLYQPPDAFSFVGRLERIKNDMSTFLSHIGLDPAASSVLGVPHRVSEHTTNASSKADIYYNETCRTIVCRLYKLDFETFNYDSR